MKKSREYTPTANKELLEKYEFFEKVDHSYEEITIFNYNTRVQSIHMENHETGKILIEYAADEKIVSNSFDH